MGGKRPNFNEKLDNEMLEFIRKLECPEIFERLMIFSDGSLGLCCGDQFGLSNLGNVLDDDPIELYNSKFFNHYREIMRKGEILNLEFCKNCSIPYSIATSIK